MDMTSFILFSVFIVPGFHTANGRRTAAGRSFLAAHLLHDPCPQVGSQPVEIRRNCSVRIGLRAQPAVLIQVGVAMIYDAGSAG